MQTKPFSVQSPEDIAKQYGGNKQKIAQACQAGIVDPTAGLLSCMFIDRMRSAQAQEMSPQPTVAQQVMAPPSQPAAPLGSPAAGLGAAAPASGAAKFFGAPPAPPAPMGMASGGLASLPVPDDMFDAGDEYAAGGIVAFAHGGSPGKEGEEPLSDAELAERARDTSLPEEDRAAAMALLRARKRTPLPEIATGDKGRTFAEWATTPMYPFGGGPEKPPVDYGKVMSSLGSWLTTPIKGGAEVPESLAMDEAALRRKLAAQIPTAEAPAPSFQPVVVQDRTKQAAPSRGLGALAPTAPAAPAAPAAPTAPAAAEQAPAAAKTDEMQAYLDALGPRPELSYLKGIDLDKQRKQDMWAALAQLGFGMAASKSPSFLGALGESATAALPGMQKSQAERRAMEREMAKAQYDEQMAARAERGEARKFQIGREDVAAQRKLEEDKLKQAMDIAKMGQATQLAVARVYAGMQSGRPLARPDILEVAQAIAEDNGRSKATEADMEKAAKMLGRGGSDKSAGATAIAALTGAKDDPLGLFKD